MRYSESDSVTLAVTLTVTRLVTSVRLRVRLRSESLGQCMLLIWMFEFVTTLLCNLIGILGHKGELTRFRSDLVCGNRPATRHMVKV